MKKHQFLQVEITNTVSLTRQEKTQSDRFIKIASLALKKSLPQLDKVKILKVSLLICGDSRIKKLNADHRGKNKVTDVLSFPANEDLRGSRKLPLENGELFLGDLAICHPQTKRQARDFKISYGDEFIHLFIHGVLHLMGYDHEVSSKEEKLQQNLEDEILSEISKLKTKKKGP